MGVSKTQNALAVKLSGIIKMGLLKNSTSFPLKRYIAHHYIQKSYEIQIKCD